MYNSELWTLTKGLEDEIDIFHRKLIRKMFNITWQDRISNKELYEKFKIKPWSLKIKEKRLRWFDHLLRLDEEAPARKALREALKPVKKCRGGQRTTWLQVVKKDLRFAHLREDQLQRHAHVKPKWNNLVCCLISQH